MPWPARTRARDPEVTERGSTRVLLDTSVVISLPTLTRWSLPAAAAVSSLTLAELSAGPHATDDPVERARRQRIVQMVDAGFDPLPFDTAAARAYGTVYAETLIAGRKARGPRAVDLMIAATALANELALVTRNADDVRHLGRILEIIPLAA